MEEYISSDNPHKLRHHTKRPKFSMMPLIGVVVLVIVGSASFYGGMQYQKDHGSKTTLSSSQSAGGNGAGGFRGRFGGGNRVIGSVTAISATSISVQNSRTNATVTLAITSSTQITNNGQVASASDIQTGTTVFVSENTSNTTQAASIMINPSFGGGSTAPSGVTSE